MIIAGNSSFGKHTFYNDSDLNGCLSLSECRGDLEAERRLGT